MQAMDTIEIKQPEGQKTLDTMDDIDAELQALAQVHLTSLWLL